MSLAEAPAPAGSSVLVDGHAHFHRCFPIERFLDSALANFVRAAAELRLPASTPGVLALMDRVGERSLERLSAARRREGGSTWTVQTTGERLSLSARGDGTIELILLAGRQLATHEGLEVLALGCDADLPEGLGLEETIAAVHEADALPIVPWGFGKWSFRRGRLVGKLLERHDARTLFLGDTRHRPRRVPTPRLFARAADRGIRVLPGSDPFPFLEQLPKIGSFGFRIDGFLDAERPSEDLKSILRSRDILPQGFGTRETLPRFLKNQLAIQLINRRRRGKTR